MAQSRDASCQARARAALTVELQFVKHLVHALEATRLERGEYARGPRWSTYDPVESSLAVMVVTWLRLDGPLTLDALLGQLPVNPQGLRDTVAALEAQGRLVRAGAHDAFLVR